MIKEFKEKVYKRRVAWNRAATRILTEYSMVWTIDLQNAVNRITESPSIIKEYKGKDEYRILKKVLGL